MVNFKITFVVKKKVIEELDTFILNSWLAFCILSADVKSKEKQGK